MTDTQNRKHHMKRILVVEDDAQVSKVFRRVLEKKGYDVVEAAEGGQALKLYQRQPADLVLLDLFMPGMEGIETLGELLGDFPAAKVIAISGGGRDGSTSHLDVAVKLGAKRSMTKPCSAEELTRTVREVLHEPP